MKSRPVPATSGLLVASLLAIVLCLSHPVQAAPEDAPLQHRMGTLIVKTSPGAEVRVEQQRHEFWFGAALASHAFSGRMDPETRRQYRDIFLANFNAAVTENALKWHAMERRRGEVDYSIVEAMLEWTDQHELPLRGHNIYWGIPNRVQSWQKELNREDLLAVLRERAFDIGRRYRGRFVEYDLNNEMMHANYYEDRLGPDITRRMAEWVREGDPEAKLYLNDYDILTGKRLDDFEAHIRRLQELGVKFDGIGVQGHLHAESFDPAALKKSLDRLAEFNLPIRITEFNLPGQRSRFYQDRRLELTPEEEEAKARDLVQYYRICFAHPAVDGILMWGFWEGANWIPTSSLFKRDWTPTPAAHAYRKLIFDEWWTKWEGRANDQGRCEIPAFFGRHRITAGPQEKIVDLKKSAGGTQTVSFRP